MMYAVYACWFPGQERAVQQPWELVSRTRESCTTALGAGFQDGHVLSFTKKPQAGSQTEIHVQSIVDYSHVVDFEVWMSVFDPII